MSIAEVANEKKALINTKLKEIFQKDFNCSFQEPKIALDHLNLFKEQFGFELVAIPGLNELPLDDLYFEKMYPNKNKFWKSEYKDSITKDHKNYGGRFILYESVQKPDFLNEIQLYGSKKGEQQGLDKIEKEFLESYEFIEAKDDLELELSSGKTRYAWSYNNISKYVIASLQREIKKAGLPGKVVIRPATNFIDTVFFPSNGETETYEWTSTQLLGTKNQLTVGHAPLGGLSCVLDHDPATYYANIGVRFAIEL